VEIVLIAIAALLILSAADCDQWPKGR